MSERNTRGKVSSSIAARLFNGITMTAPLGFIKAAVLLAILLCRAIAQTQEGLPVAPEVLKQIITNAVKECSGQSQLGVVGILQYTASAGQMYLCIMEKARVIEAIERFSFDLASRHAMSEKEYELIHDSCVLFKQTYFALHTGDSARLLFQCYYRHYYELTSFRSLLRMVNGGNATYI